MMYSVLIYVALAATPASEPATLMANVPDGATLLTVDDVLARVEGFDPLVRARAFEQLRAEILLRRAQWNRVSGSLGLNVQYGGYANGFAVAAPDPAAASAISASFFDRLTANLAASINFPIYAGNAISGAVEGAEARLQAAKLDKRTAIRDLKRAALLSYAQLVAATAQLQIAQRAAERSGVIVDMAERRRASGLATEADVARGRLNLLNRSEEVERRLGDQAIAAAILRAALVLDQDVAVVASQPIAAVRSVKPAGENSDRLEALSLRAQLLAIDADRRVAFSGWLPRLEAFGQAAYGNGQPFFIGGLAVDVGGGGTTQRFGVFSGSASFGLRVAWTAWDFFITRDNVARVDAERSAAEARLAAETRGYEREKAEARARIAQADKRVAMLAGAKDLVATAVKLARVRYETGSALLTEVLDAELEAISLEARQVQAEYDAASAHLDVLRAEGKEL